MGIVNHNAETEGILFAQEIMALGAREGFCDLPPSFSTPSSYLIIFIDNLNL